MTPDALIDRIAAWLAESQTSISAAASQAKVAENTAHAVLKARAGRIETLRRLCALVPDDFHDPLSQVGGAEREECRHGSYHSASENCDGAR